MTNRFLGRFPEERRKPALFILAGLAVLFLGLVISAFALVFSGPEKAVVNNTAGPAIPMEELFIPDEPDFLPDFLFEREPRSSWSVDDVRPWWKNPGAPELWREEIKSTVDELMEAVP